MADMGPCMEGGEGARPCPAAQTYELGSGRARQHADEPAQGCRKTRFMECPMLEKTVQESGHVRKIMEEVMVHYGASFSVLTWRADGGLRLKASHLPDVFTVPQVFGSGGYQLFNHTIDRDLPVIVYDVQGHDVYGKAPVPEFANPTRFYVATPLVVQSSAAYIGTLCVVDSSRPRADFSLREVGYLEQKARELVAAAEDHHSSAPSLGGPSGSLISNVPGADRPPTPEGVDVKNVGTTDDRLVP